MDDVLLEPRVVRALGGDRPLDLLVLDDPALLEVDEEELARREAAEAHDVLGLDRQHPGLGAEHDVAVLRLAPAAGTQAVAVERRADHGAVGEAHRRGAVPRLHQARVERVEALEVVGEVVPAGVGLRDHHHRRVRQRPPGEHQQLEDVVERRGVRPAGAHDRQDLLEVEAEELGRQLRLARPHPVRVAHERVDLAVVGDHAERMGEVPAREGVRAEARVHERERALEPLVLQVGVEAPQLVGDQHPLVDDGARRERRRVEVRARRELDDAADHVELALERVLVALEAGAGLDEQLLDVRARAVGGLADVRLVDRHVAPAEDVLALDADVELEQLLELRAAASRPAAGSHADAVAAGRGQLEVHDAAEERVGQLGEDARAVAGADVGALGAAVLEVVERRERVHDDLVRRLVVQPGDHRDAAGVVLVAGVVQAFGLGSCNVRHMVSLGGRGALRRNRER